ncbi:MAG: hypothetical protein V4478_02870 [Patescibacteria group bacterium]
MKNTALSILQKRVVLHGGLASDVNFLDEDIANKISVLLAIKGATSRLGNDAFPLTTYVPLGNNRKRRRIITFIELVPVEAQTSLGALAELKEKGYKPVNPDTMRELGRQLVDHLDSYFKKNDKKNFKTVLAVSANDKQKVCVLNWLNYSSAYPSPHTYFSRDADYYDNYLKEVPALLPLRFAAIRKRVYKK